MKAAVVVFAFLLLTSPSWAQETSAPEKPVPQVHGISVDEIVIATEVAERKPMGTATQFAKDVGKVVCFTRVEGGSESSSVTHVWYHEGQEKARVELGVRSASWRTWSSKEIMPEWTGSWKVVVLNPAGEEIGSTSFTVGG